MQLDSADLATLWVDAENLEPLARDLVRTLIDALRVAHENYDRARTTLENLVTQVDDAASDAERVVSRLLDELDEARPETDVDASELRRFEQLAEETDDELTRIRDACREAKE